jgi:hypothetical protein
VGKKATLLEIVKKKKKRRKYARSGELKDIDLKTRRDCQLAASQYYSIGCISENKYEYLELELDVSKMGKLQFLLDTGADISLIKSSKLFGTTDFDPSRKIKVKCVDGSIVETHGTVEACI